LKIKDAKTGEMREETDDERKAREESESDSSDEGANLEKVKGERDRWKGEARKWEGRAKENFSSKIGIPWDDITTAAQKYSESEAKSKTDGEKAEAARKTAEDRAVKAERDAMLLRVAMRKGLTDVQARRLVGQTEEELEADADDLLKTFKPAQEEEEEPEEKRAQPTRRPMESRRSGTGERKAPPVDAKKIVDEAMGVTT
jgi:hypothetical protein